MSQLSNIHSESQEVLSVSYHGWRTLQSHATTVSLLLALLLALSTSIPSVIGVSSKIDLPFSTSITLPIGEFETPEIPLIADSYTVRLESRYEISGTLPLTVSSEQDEIFMGDSISITYETHPFPLDLKLFIRTIVGDGDEVVFDEEEEVPLPPLQGLERYQTETITIPVELDLIGFPFTLLILLAVEADSQIPLSLFSERVQPTSDNIVFSEGSLSFTRTFTKSDGLGAKFESREIGLELTGNLFVSVLLEEIPFFRHDFPPIEIGRLSSTSPATYELLRLKTPIELEISASNEEVLVGDNFTIKGQFSPPTALNVQLQEMISSDWKMIDSVISTPEGTFRFDVNGADVGTHEFRFVHSGSEYTTETMSSVKTVTIRALPPPEIQLAEEREPIAPEQRPDQNQSPPSSLQTTQVPEGIPIFALLLIPIFAIVVVAAVAWRRRGPA